MQPFVYNFQVYFSQGKRTALYHACDMGNVKVVEALLAHKDIELNLQCKKVPNLHFEYFCFFMVTLCILISV